MHTKILIRPDNFLSRYQQWKENSRTVHLEMLRGSYANEVFGRGADDLKYESSSRSSRIIWSPTDVSIEAMSYVLDDLKNILLKNSFFLHLSDERNEIFDNGLKLTIHRHYIKPELDLKHINVSINDESSGNISLEHKFNRIHNAIFISSYYQKDKAKISFEKLMEILMA